MEYQNCIAGKSGKSGCERSMTIRELAKILNVSPAAISIVLNERQGVSDDTRKRILEAVEQYGYHPAPKRRNTFGTVLVVKYWKNGILVEENQGFVSMIVDNVTEQLRREHFAMTMKVVKVDFRQFLEEENFGNYCGMILIASEITRENFPLLAEIPIPLVVVDNTVAGYPISSVCMNNGDNVFLALRYLREKGHRQIGHLKSALPLSNFMERESAFHQYSEELGFLVDPEHIYSISPNMQGAYETMKQSIQGKAKLPTCFFADNDTIALGAIKALKESGYRIPDDVSVIGFDNIPYSAISSPGLTTIHVQRDLLGRQAVHQLIRQMREPALAPMKTVVTGELIERTSVRTL